MADEAERAGRTGLRKWLEPKRDYKKLINFLLATRMHLIICSRAKQWVEEQVVEVDGQAQRTVVTGPWEPIQDKRLKYEMTIVLPMTLDGGYETDPGRLKIPDDLAPLFTGGLLTEATGAAIATWVGGGKPTDHGFEALRRDALEKARAGTGAFTTWWNSRPLRAHRKALRRDFDNLVSIARAADAEMERGREAKEETRSRVADAALLDNPFGARPARIAPNTGDPARAA